MKTHSIAAGRRCGGISWGGLGLALVKRIAERHEGSVTYEAQPGGARFVVRLPAAKES